METIQPIFYKLQLKLFSHGRNADYIQKNKYMLNEIISLRELGDLDNFRTSNNIINNFLDKIKIDILYYQLVPIKGIKHIPTDTNILHQAVEILCKSKIIYSDLILYVLLYRILKEYIMKITDVTGKDIHTVKTEQESATTILKDRITVINNE